MYNQARQRDWYRDFAQEIWGDPIPVGFSKSDFIKACERNNDGKGILYLIKCFLGDEVFYKIGITSQSLKKRYSHDGTRPNVLLNYCYELIWTMEGDSEVIWDVEKGYKQKTKEIRYQPDLWPNNKSTETFKCHGNCKILREPSISSSLNF